MQPARPVASRGEGPPNRVCFFARVRDPELLERVQFYAQDLRILRSLGYDVRIVTRIRDLRPADLYYVWWWTWAFAPVTLARLLRRPCVISGVIDWHEMGHRPRWHRRLIEYALRHASANIFVSQLERDNVTRAVRVNNPCYSPLTVDTAKYSPRNAPLDDTVLDDTVLDDTVLDDTVLDDTVLTIAWMHTRNAERKCIAEVIQAAALVRRTHPRVRFVIAGEQGTAYPALRALRDRLGAQEYVEFVGVISEAEKIDRLRHCGVYLQPSRFEGFGLAILEAMSCGATVVSSAVGAVPEVLGDTGLCVDGSSPPEIARAVCEILDRRAVSDWGQRARQRAVESFSWARRRQDLEAVLNPLLGPSSAAPPANRKDLTERRSAA